jgi:hypothetical protein
MRSILGCLLILGFSGVQALHAGPTNRPPAAAQAPNEFDKLNEEIKNLPPAEKQARIKAFNERHGLKDDDLKKRYEEYIKMTPEQRRAKLQARLTELKKKEAAGTITVAEKEQLKNMEEWMKRKPVNLNTNSVPTAKATAITTNKPPYSKK